MKKLTAIILSLLMLVAFASCTASVNNTESTDEETSAGSVGLANPMTEVASLDEINNLLGSKLSQPGVMGVTDEKFYTIDCGDYTIGQYNFSINGAAYWIRFSANMTDDISGVYAGESTIFANMEGEGNIALEDASYSRWFTLEGQYIFCMEGEDIDPDQFATIAEEIEASTASWYTEEELTAYHEGLAGSYQDSVSQRASAEIEAKEDCVVITVYWADSAAETNVWTMTAKLAEDGLLNYSDCKYTKEGETTETVYENGEGFFTPQDDGSLIWDGAADENCVECTFAKVEA